MRGTRRSITRLAALAVAAWLGTASAEDRGLDPAAVERGRIALTQNAFLKPAWKAETYYKVGEQWGIPYPDPKCDPGGYAAAFNERYGLHPAPFPNDGLPLGLRRGLTKEGKREGIVVDCMICHGGSIGGTSYVGLGNSTLDIKSLFEDMFRAEGKKTGPSPFVANTTRGTVNAGQMAVFLISFRNPDFSRRRFPLPLGANYPELDVPAWWHLGRKETMYYDGRTDAHSIRSNMQFIMGEKDLDEMKALEPVFADVQAYLKSLKPPKYPFPIDGAKAAMGRAVFGKNCTKCHGTYGPGGEYPSRIVDLKTIGTDPDRAYATTRKAVEHYNSTWLGENHPANLEMTGYQAPPLDGVWATAPYLHNGSVPTLHAVLKSSERPRIFRRPSSTDFVNYDKTNVGWIVEPLATLPDVNKLGPYAGKFIFDTSRYGLGNGGHTFGDRLSEDERMAVIEYLKSL
jgi:mono/diheme cytochrome c family protein